MRVQRLFPLGIALGVLSASAWGTDFVYNIYQAHPDGNLPSLIASFAAMLAVFGWLAQSWIAIRNTRKQHSINVLFQTRMNGEYQAFQKVISDSYPGGKSLFQVADLTKPQSDVDRAILFMLNYYEFISVGIWHGDLDESIMRDCIRSQFLSFTRRARLVIAARRGEDQNGRPDPAKALIFKSLLHQQEQWQAHFWRTTGTWPRQRH